MGATSSKPAKAVSAAAKSTARKYPNRPSPTTTTSSATPSATNAPSRPPPAAAGARPGPTVRPQARASGSRDAAINLDASDPDFAASLRSLGAVQPNPTYSNTSTFSPSVFPSTSSPNSPSRPNAPNPALNPALLVLQSRSRLADEAEQEFLTTGKRGDTGRSFLDVGTLRQIIALRDQRGLKSEEIERQLGLKSGVVARLGAKGVIGVQN